MSNEQLVEQIRNGNYVTENMQRLYENNLPLLRKFIKPYIHLEPEEDLLQEAFFGLHEAVQHYESSENVLFMTYAYYWIRQSVVKYIENCGSIIRWPAGFKQKMNRYNKSVREFIQEYGKIPTDWEMAEALGMGLPEIEEIKIALQEVASLDAPLTEDDELSLSDTIADKYSLEDDVTDKVYSEQLESELWPIVEHHTDIQQNQVIRGYYKDGMTLGQIAEGLGISVEQARQCREAGIRQLRRYKAVKALQEKLDVVTGSAYRTGLTGCRQMGSKVEYIAIRRAELEEEIKILKKTK